MDKMASSHGAWMLQWNTGIRGRGRTANIDNPVKAGLDFKNVGGEQSWKSYRFWAAPRKS
jgi:hypothetical protein